MLVLQASVVDTGGAPQHRYPQHFSGLVIRQARPSQHQPAPAHVTPPRRHQTQRNCGLQFPQTLRWSVVCSQEGGAGATQEELCWHEKLNNCICGVIKERCTAYSGVCTVYSLAAAEH